MNWVLGSILDFFFPTEFACIICGREMDVGLGYVCKKCQGQLTISTRLKCPSSLDGITAAWVYEGAIIPAIHKLKYENARYLAKPFAQNMIIDPLWRADAIIPVPLHKARKRKRGYNQSELIARELGSISDMPLAAKTLIRTVDTKTQTKLTAKERSQNIAGAFACVDDVKGKSFILVDDVVTTGSTISACAEKLKQSGAKRVFAACVCSHPLNEH